MKFGGVLLIVKDINKSKKFYEDVMEQNYIRFRRTCII